MGLYNMVFGHHDHAPLVLALLDRGPSFFGRFRDAWIEKNEAGEIRLAVYTRNGGGNRYDQRHAWSDIQDHPGYLQDRDDDNDGTYATAYFRLPDEVPAPLVAALPEELRDKDKFYERLKQIAQDAPNMGERWSQAIDAIKRGGSV